MNSDERVRKRAPGSDAVQPEDASAVKEQQSNGAEKTPVVWRRLEEPYEQHSCKALRKECVERGLKPTEVHGRFEANKEGFIARLRENDRVLAMEHSAKAPDAAAATRSPADNERGVTDGGEQQGKAMRDNGRHAHAGGRKKATATAQRDGAANANNNVNVNANANPNAGPAGNPAMLQSLADMIASSLPTQPPTSSTPPMANMRPPPVPPSPSPTFAGGLPAAWQSMVADVTANVVGGQPPVDRWQAHAQANDMQQPLLPTHVYHNSNGKRRAETPLSPRSIKSPRSQSHVELLRDLIELLKASQPVPATHVASAAEQAAVLVKSTQDLGGILLSLEEKLETTISDRMKQRIKDEIVRCRALRNKIENKVNYLLSLQPDRS